MAKYGTYIHSNRKPAVLVKGDSVWIPASSTRFYHSLFPDNCFNIDTVFTFHTSQYYYELCSRYSSDVEIWETDYYHIMNSDEEIFNMIATTGIKPYLDSLYRDEDKELLSQSIKDRLTGKYYHADNRKVLFPFKRMFLILRKDSAV